MYPNKVHSGGDTNLHDQQNPLNIVSTSIQPLPSSIATTAARQVALTTVGHTRKDTCSEVRHFVFVKVHKAGSDTLAVLFQRFGDERNLSFVLPVHEWDLHWPHTLRERDYLPLKTNEFNLLTYHCLYNRSIMRRLMPAATRYVTVLREPYSQFKSTFNYFNLPAKMRDRNISTLPVDENFGLFLSDPQRFRRELKLSYLPNFLAFDLGYPPERDGAAANVTKAFEFIAEIERDFTLVMITEYFDESLVLLRRALCWPIHSILYVSKNVRKYNKGVGKPNASDPIDQRNKRRYRDWSPVDYVLYAHFNATLWRRAAAEPRFHEEVDYFRELLADVSTYCLQKKEPRLALTVAASEWHEQFDVAPSMCARMKESVLKYIKKLKGSYNALPNVTTVAPPGVSRVAAPGVAKAVGENALKKQPPVKKSGVAGGA
ncbi:PREDICTED: galactosylceramide sulfotransferase-like [Priapulus caudatus]|uniref:Galactosylceramide sulfotransferase-like n=1 Tax=Priapulus caudatus TaxID=37621 RepID=A0ABM1DYS5_PRICU|nr:PREDICTED: galactosylceramide sulfotransferase-like [Priapulus caudatus]